MLQVFISFFPFDPYFTAPPYPVIWEYHIKYCWPSFTWITLNILHLCSGYGHILTYICSLPCLIFYFITLAWAHLNIHTNVHEHERACMVCMHTHSLLYFLKNTRSIYMQFPVSNVLSFTVKSQDFSWHKQAPGHSLLHTSPLLSHLIPQKILFH